MSRPPRCPRTGPPAARGDREPLVCLLLGPYCSYTYAIIRSKLSLYTNFFLILSKGVLYWIWSWMRFPAKVATAESKVQKEKKAGLWPLVLLRSTFTPSLHPRCYTHLDPDGLSLILS